MCCCAFKADASRAADPGLDSPFLPNTQAALSGAWHYRVSAGTGWLGVSKLWLGEIERLICSFCLRVAACKNCLSRSVPEIHQHVAGTFKQPTNKHQLAQSPSHEMCVLLSSYFVDTVILCCLVCRCERTPCIFFHPLCVEDKQTVVFLECYFS